MIFDVYDQRKPKRIKGTDDWMGNLVLVGTVDARDGIEAIKVAKRKRLSPWPIVCEQEQRH